MESPDNTPSETITLGGGCFWLGESTYRCFYGNKMNLSC